MQMIAPQCLDDKVDLEVKWYVVTTKDNQNHGCNLEYCPQCKSYLTTKGMEKDLTKAAYDFLEINSPPQAYQLSDILKIEEM